MRKCHACQREVDQAAVTAGKCPHCGAVLLKLSQRTIEDKQSLRDQDDDGDNARATMDDLSGDHPSEESLEFELAEGEQAGPTIQMGQSETADENGGANEASEPPEKKTDPERKSPTVADGSDLTIMF